MSDEQDNPQDEYTPPAVWAWDTENGGRFSAINRPIAGATHEQELPRGDNPLQLYSLATPNGVKVTALLEELLDLGHSGAEYDAYTINIGKGEQFGSGFVDINPNSKIPALLDLSTPNPTRGLRVRGHHGVFGRKVWGLVANGTLSPSGMSVLAVLANGQRTILGWRFRTLLRLRSPTKCVIPSTASPWK
jgi:hypothetical protein